MPFGEEKNARYKAALKKFADKHAEHELSAMARSQWAQVLQGEGEPGRCARRRLARGKGVPGEQRRQAVP